MAFGFTCRALGARPKVRHFALAFSQRAITTGHCVASDSSALWLHRVCALKHCTLPSVSTAILCEPERSLPDWT